MNRNVSIALVLWLSLAVAAPARAQVPVTVTVPTPAPRAGAPAGPGTANPAGPSRIPRTGADLLGMLALAALLFASGLVLVRFGRGQGGKR